jgi:hypothetical protein
MPAHAADGARLCRCACFPVSIGGDCECDCSACRPGPAGDARWRFEVGDRHPVPVTYLAHERRSWHRCGHPWSPDLDSSPTASGEETGALRESWKCTAAGVNAIAAAAGGEVALHVDGEVQRTAGRDQQRELMLAKYNWWSSCSGSGRMQASPRIRATRRRPSTASPRRSSICCLSWRSSPGGGAGICR